MKNLKPLLWGTALGIVLAAVGGFSAGWIERTSTGDRRVAEAVTGVHAGYCAEDALASYASTGDSTPLKGYQARQKREELAKQFSTGSTAVTQACAKLIEQQSVV